MELLWLVTYNPRVVNGGISGEADEPQTQLPLVLLA